MTRRVRILHMEAYLKCLDGFAFPGFDFPECRIVHEGFEVLTENLT
jgi:hypothetical protein